MYRRLLSHIALSGLLSLFCVAHNSPAIAQENLSRADAVYQELKASTDSNDQQLADKLQALVSLQEWTNKSGKFKARAKYLDHGADRKTVKLLVVREVEVSVDALSSECQARTQEIFTILASINESPQPKTTKAKSNRQIAIYVDPPDKQFARGLQEILRATDSTISTVEVESLGQAATSKADVLLLVMTKAGERYSDRLLQSLRQRKIIGIGTGSADLFNQMGLQLFAGLHYGRDVPKLIKPQASQLLGNDISTTAIAPYSKPEDSEGDNFSMGISRHTEYYKWLDIIATVDRDDSLAQVVRQGNCVLIGFAMPVSNWTKEYTEFFGQIALAVINRDPEPFVPANFDILPPGLHKFELAPNGATREPDSKTFYFKFKRPTRFVATLDHNGSDAMMMLFMGDSDRLHWTRKDASEEEGGTAGESLRIDVEITSDDLSKHGDRYWHLSVTNFDRVHRPPHTAACRLKVDYVP